MSVIVDKAIRAGKFPDSRRAFYEGADDMNRAREIFPAHRAKWQDFAARGELLMIGPFTDPRQGAMGVFTTRAAAATGQ